jgi:hypothetical protein
MWNIPADPPLDGPKLLATAVSAGFRLGDWDLAFDLLDRYIGTRPAGERGESIQSFALPDITRVVDPEAARRLSRIPGLLPSIVAWFKVTDDALRAPEIGPDGNPLPQPPRAARTAEGASQMDALKITEMRKERKTVSEKRLLGRLRNWWRRMRGRTPQSDASNSS